MTSIQLEQMPQSVEAFIAQRDQLACTPEGGAAMMVAALLLYATDEALGQQCLTVAVDRSRLQQGNQGYQGWQLTVTDQQLIRLQIKGQPHLPRSYIHGATPANGYELPNLPYEIVFSENPYSGDRETGRFKVFVASSGASTPRPITVQRNERGIWKASEWSTLLVGVQKPITPAAQDDL